MLNFFDRVSKLERIVNISSLLVGTTRTPARRKPSALTIRAQREHYRDLHGDHIFQSTIDTFRGQRRDKTGKRR